MLSDGYRIVTELVLPPASLFLLLAVGLLVSWRWRRLGRTLAGLAVVLLVALSLPAVADALGRILLPAPPPLARPLTPDACQAIVVPGGGVARRPPEWGHNTVSGDTLARLRFAIALARESGLPLAVSGGRPLRHQETSEAALMRRTAEQEFRHPVRWIEEASRTTRENAVRTRALLAPAGIDTICLTTHAAHMPRAAESFRRVGFQVVAAPLGLAADLPAEPVDFVPQAGGLAKSRAVLRETLGRLWYRLRGP